MNEVFPATAEESTASQPAEFRIAGEKSNRVDQYSEYLSDWFSPILVKETRQALKSRQFFWTFFLLLAAVAIWTLIGLTVYDTRVEYGNAGPSLLTGFWVILGFPLAIVIPFGAYRSLAREYEDGTIQLISVTTMKAWQIVAGKLGSSMLQMLIYLAVLAPCIAFTYLLRGLSFPQIIVGMAFCIAGSFALSCVALFFAGATRSRIYGVGVSILLILLQCFVYWLWIMGAWGMAFGELGFLCRSEGLFVSYGILAAVVSTGLLMFAAATILISFQADNRSTIVRVMMLIQQTLFVGWSISLMSYMIEPEMAAVLTFVTAHYWLLMGLVMVGEDVVLSHRVQRSIPATVATRSLFSFFLPGSGRGLMFAITNIWFCGFAFLTFVILGPEWVPEAEITQPLFGTRRSAFGPGDWRQIVPGVISICIYASFFLSVVYFLCGWLRKNRLLKVNPVVSFALGIVLVLSLTGFSLLFHYNFLPHDEARYYSVDQIFNWYWTSIELADSGFNNVDPLIATMAFLFMSGVCVAAMISASRELLQQRLTTPDRVQQEIEESRSVEQLPPGETIDEIFGVDRVEVD